MSIQLQAKFYLKHLSHTKKKKKSVFTLISLRIYKNIFTELMNPEK